MFGRNRLKRIIREKDALIETLKKEIPAVKQDLEEFKAQMFPKHRTGIINIFRDKRKEFRFHVKARNGKIIVASQGYKNKDNAHIGIESLKEVLKNPEIRDI